MQTENITEKNLYDNISFVKRQMKKYPFIENMDIYKMIYQTVYLSGHLLSSNVYQYLQKEIQDISINNLRSNCDLYEYISNEVVRINLVPYLNYINKSKKKELIDLTDLNNKFIESSKIKIDKDINEEIKIIKDANIVENKVVCKLNDMNSVRNILPVHSNIYKNHYQTHYRIIHSSLLDVDIRVNKLNDFINSLSDKSIIAVEGRCASGKTTITNQLESINKSVTVIHADDFFSPNKSDRLDFNRLIKLIETIKKEKENKVIEYEVYDCKTKSYYNKNLTIKKYIIIEGVYSFDERLREYYDKMIFFIVDKQTQKNRLEQRCNKELLEKFNCIWIPREEDYYNKYDFILKADSLI